MDGTLVAERADAVVEVGGAESMDTALPELSAPAMIAVAVALVGMLVLAALMCGSDDDDDDEDDDLEVSSGRSDSLALQWHAGGSDIPVCPGFVSSVA
mgnify:CR=1 FL=1